MSKAKKPDTTHAPADPPPPSETWLRVLAPLSESEAQWKQRDPVNRAMFAVSGAADRIGGLAEICWTLNLADIQAGGQWRGERGLRNPFGFIARILSDVAAGLREADKLYTLEMARQDEAAHHASRRAGK